ncbi:MAG: hypothetical protein IJ428_05800 [Clostridia bacterium]|nr:hypothetical protein [Clostridia bacterium]
MIGALPTSLCVGGEERRIRSDFRTVLLILEACADAELNEREKACVCVECLYEDEIPPELYSEALERASWFIDGGNAAQSRVNVRVMDWAQDEALIFPAINKVAGKETRSETYIHWWTFLGYFCEIGEGSFSTVVAIRYKLARGKPLEKYERDYLRDNSDRVKLRGRYTAEEDAERERLKSIFT